MLLIAGLNPVSRLSNMIKRSMQNILFLFIDYVVLSDGECQID